MNSRNTFKMSRTAEAQLPIPPFLKAITAIRPLVLYVKSQTFLAFRVMVIKTPEGVVVRFQNCAGAPN
jgi:hypothetical protein